LSKIAVDGDIPGLGDTVNDLVAAVANGTAALPEDGAVFTPLETADGTQFDADDAPVTDPNVGTTFTLTTGVDNVAGGVNNDTINAYINSSTPANSTFTAADVIDAGTGTDSLNLVVEGTAASPGLPAATTTGVEQFFIRDVNTNAAKSTYDFGSVVGETQVWANTSVTTNGTIAFTGLGTGTTVGLKGNNVLTNLDNVEFAMASVSDAVSIAIDGGVKNTVAPTITNTGVASAPTAATISSSGAANTVGAVTLAAAAGNSVKSLTVNAATDLTATLVAADYAADATLTVTGAGKANLGAGFDGATIDASGNKGGLTISTTAGVTKALTGSSAADTVTVVGALAASAAVNLGAGDDKVLAGAGASIPATATIDGGEGKDSISASLINAGNAAKVVNFEELDITAATTLDVSLVSGSTITGLTLSGPVAGVSNITNVAKGVGLTISGDNSAATHTIGVKDAATATDDTFAITFANADIAGAAPVAANVKGGTTILEGIESISVASGGGANTWNSLALTDANMKMVTITGDKNLDLTFVGVNGTNPVATQGGAVNMIDGSAATGKLNINTTNVTADDKAGVGLAVKGGTADDTITLAQKATVDGGAGKDTITTAAAGGTLTGGADADTFKVGASIATGTTEAASVLTTITDFLAGDKIEFGANATGAFNTTKVDVGAAANLGAALALAGTHAANSTSWFEFAGNTYIVSNTDAAAGSGVFDAGDTVVKITGLVDLSNDTFAALTLTAV
jgi:hypothetical protein